MSKSKAQPYYLECSRTCPACGKEWFGKGHWSGGFDECCSQECFGDYLWMQRAEEHEKNPRIIIDGCMYSDAGAVKNPSNRNFLGHAGRWFRIKMGNKVWDTNNLWCGGDIPEKFRDRMPDNAVFLN